MNEIKKQACFLVFILLIALTGCGRSDDITMEVRLYKCILEDDPVSTYAGLKKGDTACLAYRKTMDDHGAVREELFVLDNHSEKDKKKIEAAENGSLLKIKVSPDAEPVAIPALSPASVKLVSEPGPAEERHIDMISYNPKEKKLTITLRSEGEGRGTSSDFRNHTEITEFLRYTNKSIRQYVQELECKFYDVRDKLILDIETSNIEETGNTDSKTNDLSREEAEKKIKALLEDNHLNIEDFSYQELFSSGKEKLCVKASASKEDALALMAVIENLRHSIRAVCQVPDVCIFEMSLAAENEELFCVHDDYLHGHWQSWMSPEMDKEFAKHNGPGE